ncbi:RluA family pseudouridine synthase [Xanthocytophaga flava]|uniref:RluA family pseudouridine synthase n=1 Tax=Xanthocytophaga flava TaxID=3048013 RepID=UPI0028D50C6F|nr:pseudouridine synthase [Xanthocytophaga flavus]MDJ1469327.1 pseudouridine synthase [Xanthocytophaga flavus]
MIQSIKDIVLFENDDYILVNKPPHVATLDERTGDKSSILRIAKNYHSDIQAGHRLDKETSGVLALAKNPEAYRHLSMQFEHRQVDKIYHAVVHGTEALENVNVYLPILPLKDGSVRIDTQSGKEAETFFDTMAIYKKHSLVQCAPVTGRMHQIRIHLSCLKMPIVCDPQYGGAPIFLSEIKRKFNLKQGTEEQPLIQRVALHAFSLSFHLLNDELITVEAPYPKDMQALIKQLEKNV